MSTLALVLLGCVIRGDGALHLNREEWTYAYVWERRERSMEDPRVDTFFEESLAASPDDVEVLWRYASWRWWQAEAEVDPTLRHARLSDARSRLLYALVLQPDSLHVRYQLGLVEFELGHLDAAELLLQRVPPMFMHGGGVVALIRVWLERGDAKALARARSAVDALELRRTQGNVVTPRYWFARTKLFYLLRDRARVEAARTIVLQLGACMEPEASRRDVWLGREVAYAITRDPLPLRAR